MRCNLVGPAVARFFNTFVFKLEEKLYASEGIGWDPLDFPDNQDCLDVLQEKPKGVFAMLDEECFVPQESSCCSGRA